MLESVTMPWLRELYICRDPTVTPSFWTNSAFLSFTDRSSLGMSLTHLEIQPVVQDQELIQCLELLPLLQRLWLWDCEDHNRHAVVTDFLLDRLACTQGEPVIVPGLEYCHFRTILRFGDESLHRFIRFRAGDQDSEETFEIDFTLPPTPERTFSPNFLAQMEELQAEREGFLFSIQDNANYRKHSEVFAL
ncbi:hypothetical protein FB45DRAFT_1020208 [Roridomyces roridus]|uniref:Uncharacterized protein n=1 Tax=Roridomyces roridus TaxID=1738132 RepID=A0AAD7CGJ0_9AGAR|nr:hypothetical protein FB45DRAFT_1020208 [Roridomyces roridus]